MNTESNMRNTIPSVVLAFMIGNAANVECTLNIAPGLVQKISIQDCIVDTIVGANLIGDVDLNTVNADLLYGVEGYPLCGGCSAIEVFQSNQSMYKIIDITKFDIIDSIDFLDTENIKAIVNKKIDIYTPFVYQSSSTFALCWVENLPSIPVGGYGDPQAGILHCRYMEDKSNQFSFQGITIGYHRDIPGGIVKKSEIINMKINNKDFDLLGRLIPIEK